MFAVAAALAVALIIPLYGYWREVVAKGDQPIAIVHEQVFTTQFYARFLGFQESLLQREIQGAAEQASKAPLPTAVPTAQPTPTAGAGTPTANPATPAANPTPVLDPASQAAQMEMQFLQQRAQSLPDDSLNQLIDGKLVREEAARRGLTASPEEIDAALQKEMSDYSFGSYTASEATGQPRPLLTIDQAREELRAVLAKGKFLSEDEHKTYALEPTVLKGKIAAALGGTVGSAGEQVRARHILVDTEEQAKAVEDRLSKGEDFATIAREVSKDTSNKDQGGELGWFPRGQMVAEFEQAAFSLKAGETSQPVKTSFGYHVIQVEERDANRPFSPDYIQQQQQKAFDDWLAGVKSADPQGIQSLSNTGRQTWADKFIADQLKATATTPTPAASPPAEPTTTEPTATPK